MFMNKSKKMPVPDQYILTRTSVHEQIIDIVGTYPTEELANEAMQKD